MSYNRDSDEVFSKPLSVYGHGHVTESIFYGKTAVIAMAEVVGFCKDQRPNREGTISLVLKGVDADSTVFLHDEEAEAFRAAWCTYRHELEKGTLCTIETVQLGDMKHEIRHPELNPEVTEIIKRHLENLGFVASVTGERQSHSTRDYFEHFMSYMGYWDHPKDVQDMLWVAYAHGADSNEADEIAKRPYSPEAVSPTLEIPAAVALDSIKQAMKADPAYAWSWHCNIAMSHQDAMVAAGYTDSEARHKASNDGATRFMKLCFGVDISSYDGSSALSDDSPETKSDDHEHKSTPNQGSTDPTQ